MAEAPSGKLREPLGLGMHEGESTVLWPAMGCPQRIAGDPALRVVVSLPAGKAADAIGGALLREVGSGDVVELERLGVMARDLTEVAAPGPWPAWVCRRFPRVAELELRLPAILPLERRRCRLYDLEVAVSGRTVLKPSAVYVASDAEGDDRILYATDLHVARRWQELREGAARLFRARGRRTVGSPGEMARIEVADAWSSDCFIDSLVDANRNLARFVTLANRLWELGELDLIVFGGDLVDYKHSRIRAAGDQSFEGSEWSWLEDILLGRVAWAERLRVPIYTALGNHDYRLYPYKLQIYGLRHSGIADEVTKEYLKRSGDWARLRYRPADLDAIRVSTGAEHSLEHYYRRFNPFNAYTTDLGEARLVVLDTGPDYYCVPGNLFGPRWRHFLTALASNESGPRSTGVDAGQLDLLASALDGAGDRRPVIVVSHAPVINPASPPVPAAEEVDLGLRLEQFEPGSAAEDRRRHPFERAVRRRGLDHGAVFCNQLPFLEALRRSSGQVVVLSGHNHRGLEIALDKAETRLLIPPYSEEGEPPEAADHRVLLLQTSALGHIKRSELARGLPSFRRLTVAGGRFTELAVQPLAGPVAPGGRYDWRVARQGAAEELEFTYHGPAPGRAGDNWTAVVAWLRHDLAAIAADRLEAIRVEVGPRTAVGAFEDRRYPEQGGYLAAVVRTGGPLELSLRNRPDSLVVTFLFESFVRSDAKFLSSTLIRHHRSLGSRPGLK